MNALQLKSQADELNFRGELIAESESTVTFEDGTSFCLQPKTYAVEGGGYVSSLQCRFPAGSGKSYFSFEEIDCLEDVEKFFYVFETSEIFGAGMKSLSEDRDEVARRLKTLSTEYEKVVFQFLDCLQAEVTARGTTDRVKTDAKKASIWKKLGIG